MQKQIFKTIALTVSALCLTTGTAISDTKLETPILLIGDSMMRIMGHAMERRCKAEGIDATSFASLGSGLARPDAINWVEKAGELIAEHKPATVVALFGANDRQTLRNSDGREIHYGTPAWRVEYTARVSGFIDAVLEDPGVKHLVWLLLPDMKDPQQQEHGLLINEIVAEEAAKDTRLGKMLQFDMRSVLTRQPGTYTAYVMSPTGLALTVRDPDGIHLSSTGGKLLAEALVKRYWKP